VAVVMPAAPLFFFIAGHATNEKPDRVSPDPAL
jgi:hypothetical protein